MPQRRATAASIAAAGATDNAAAACAVTTAAEAGCSSPGRVGIVGGGAGDRLPVTRNWKATDECL